MAGLPEARRFPRMKTFHIPRSPLSRRAWLRSAGISVALPWLDCMLPRAARGNEPAIPRRLLLISNNLGVLPKLFFPPTSGSGGELSPYLEILREHRQDFTVCSGLSHPGVTGGHSTENCFLTAARGPTKSGFRNTLSLDQFAAESIGQETRFPTLNLGVNIDKANRSLAWTRDGVLLPAEDRAPALFQKMFLQGEPAALARQMRRLDERASILDTLTEETQRLNRRLGSSDRDRLDQYLTSIREVEDRLSTAREWESRPKPKPPGDLPEDIQDKKRFIDKFRLMLDMARLAFESDSTRIVTLMVDAFATPVFQLRGDQHTSDGYHNLSHHGQSEEKLRQLEEVDRQQMALLSDLFRDLAARPEGGQRLLDRTAILYGSNMGDANTHVNDNLPILLAGGGFRHGRNLAFAHDHNVPLSNLFVSLLQRCGIEADAFGSSTGTLTGLEMIG